MAFPKGVEVGQQRNVLPSGKGVVKTARWTHPVLEIKRVIHKHGVAGFTIFTKPLVFFKRTVRPPKKGA
jgi:hypothetical protein